MNHRTNIFQHNISKKQKKKRNSQSSVAEERHAEISVAVAVVVELNTPLALPPPINKTLKCIRRKGAPSPSCITLFECTMDTASLL